MKNKNGIKKSKGVDGNNNNNNRLEVRVVRTNDSTKEDESMEFVVKLDPDRYEHKIVNGRHGYFDKLARIFIDEDTLKLMFDEIIRQPIKGVEFTSDIYSSIVESQIRVRKALMHKSSHNYSNDNMLIAVASRSEHYLERHINSNIDVVVLYVDIAGSTSMSMRLSADKLALLIKVFVQEMSYLIAAYNGYVLKYAGDCVIAFFPPSPHTAGNASIQCIRAVNCARSMLTITRYAINPVLRENGYPMLRIKIGIDVGENKIVRIGSSLDLLGYTMSITAKIVELAKAWRVVIGKWVYDALPLDVKSMFRELKLSKDEWDYRDSREGKYYNLYIMKRARRLNIRLS
jgi:adenylate cyclase